MCSRPAKTPKLDAEALEPNPDLEEKGPSIDLELLPTPTSSKSPQRQTFESQASNPDSSSDVTLVLETPGVSSRINSTIKLQTILDSLDEAMEEEIDRVQKRFYRQKRPYFDERRLVLEQIPYFWRTTLLRHPDLADSMEPLDVEILEHLYSVDILEYSDGDCGYRISFFFNENPFFSNREFTKEVRMMDSEELVSIGTKIKWKEPYTSLNRRLKVGDKRGQDEPRCEFFHWFSSSNSKYLDRIGEILKDDIWPNPVKFFLPHSGSTDELVVLSDSESESDADQLTPGEAGRLNSDVISIDDDEEYEAVSPCRDGRDQATPELLNGEVASPRRAPSSSPSLADADSRGSSMHQASGSSPLIPDGDGRNGVPLNPAVPAGEAPAPNANADLTGLHQPLTQSTSQPHLELEVQQESEA